MRAAERADIFRQLREAEDAIMAGKGEEYSRGLEDVNSNFKTVAELLGGAPMDDLTVAGVYFLKHVLSLADYIVHRHKEPPSGEGIVGRIHDVRNYAGILASIIEEKRLADQTVVVKTYGSVDVPETVFEAVPDDNYGCEFPWCPRPAVRRLVERLRHKTPDALNYWCAFHHREALEAAS